VCEIVGIGSTMETFEKMGARLDWLIVRVLAIGGFLMLRGVGYGWAGCSYLDYFSEMCENIARKERNEREGEGMDVNYIGVKIEESV
jgi:hypothetical protein